MHVFGVVHPELRRDFPPLRTGYLRVTDPPTPLDSFVGRAREREEVAHLLGSARIVTLLGPGGTGKTRLALQVAQDVREAFAGSVCFVDLSPHRETDSALSAIARAIGIQDRGDRPLLEALASEIGRERLLLVLDNFEQVTVAAASVANLLQECPNLTVLVTSRESLHVSGEHIYLVDPLDVPAAGASVADVEAVATSEAVALFVDRAKAVRPGFELDVDNVGAVVELCARLDGLPLAIELAAARVALLTPEALVARLGDRLRLLRGGSRDLPERQQTLRGTIDWSYELLDPAEQRLFRVFSVFSSASFEAVETVVEKLDGEREPGGPDAPGGLDVLDGLASLVDKSLIRRVEGPDRSSRLLMLETIRDFAASTLAADPDLEAATRSAHASYFTELAERERDELTGHGRDAAAERMVREIDNIEAAWDHWVGRSDFEQLSRLADSLWPLYDMRSWYQDTVELATDLLQVLSTRPDTPERRLQRITLQTSLARVLMGLRGYTAEVEEAFRRSLEMAEDQADVPELLPALRGLASLHVYRAEFDKSYEIGRRMMGLARQQGDVTAQVEAHVVLGASKVMLSDLEGAERELEDGIATYDPDVYAAGRYRAVNNPAVVCFTTSAITLWLLGLADSAIERAREGTEFAHRLNHPMSIGYAEFHAGLLFHFCRKHEDAEAAALAVVAIAGEHDIPVWRAVGSCLRGAALAELGRAEEGLAILEDAMSLYQSLRTPPVFLPILFQVQAATSGLAGAPGARLALLDEAIALAGRGPGSTLAPELLRVRGELQLAADGDRSQAHAWFVRALDTATQVGAPMLQLRSALSLARVLRDEGRSTEARAILEPIHGCFIEGRDLPDLVDARTLLDELA